MSTYSEGNDASLAIGLNLVNNPRDLITDTVLKKGSGYNITKSLIFSSVSRFIKKFDKFYLILKNTKEETKNPFPYGICNAYISNTFVDFSLLEKDCIKFVKDQKTEALNYLKDLDKYLTKAVADRAGETPESREITKAILNTEILELQNKIKDLQAKFPLKQLSKINEQKYTLTSTGIQYELDLQSIRQKKLQFENQYKDLQKEIFELNKQIKIIYASNIDVDLIQDEDGNGLLKDTKEAITKQEVFLNEPFLEISTVDFGIRAIDTIASNYKNRTYGNSIFWATTMPKPFLDKDCTSAGLSLNREHTSIFKAFFAKRAYNNESNPEVFSEEIYYPQEMTYTVMCHIKKNSTNTQYGVFYLTPEDSPYLTSLLNNRETLLEDVEFYPLIPIRQNSKDLVKSDPKEIFSILGFACEELLRQLHINIYGITKAINTLGEKVLQIVCKDTSIMYFIKNRYELYSASYMKPSYSQNDSSNDLYSYYENKPNKLIRESLGSFQVNSFIQDVYIALGISVDNFDSSSAKYLYEFFSKLKPECKVTKDIFLSYINHQQDTSYKYFDNYNLENRVSIRNNHDETLLIFNYIEEETLPDKWEYWNPLYKDIILNYAETNIVQKPQTQIYQNSYDIWDTPSLILHDRNSDHYSIWGGIEYDNNILEIYYQESLSSYKKISIHGLKITYNRRYSKLDEFVKYQYTGWGYYNNDKILDREYRLRWDSSTYSLQYNNLNKNNQIADTYDELDLITPKENKDLSNFIIPMWHHDITKEQYTEKNARYTINDINNVLQRSLNLLIFGTLQNTQHELIPNLQDYFVPIVHRKKVLLSCLDSFISKYNKFEISNRFLQNIKDTENSKEKEEYSKFFYQICTNPNISTFLPIPPDHSNPSYIVGQNIRSFDISSQLTHHKTTTHFEKLCIDNKIFGKITKKKHY